MDGLDGLMNVYMNGWITECVSELMDGWMDRLLNVYLNG